MQWLEMKIIFEKTQAEWVVDLLAEVFYTRGLKGVVIDDPALDPHADWASDALPPAEHPALTGYLPGDDRLETRRLEIENEIALLAGHHCFDFAIRYQTIDEEDWAESWKAFFHPQKVSKTLVVKPTWRTYSPGPDEQVIEIDPGMAFGTGTHPTTMLCMRLLEKYLRSGQSVLDVGTGSGILLITAHKLGAAKLTGVDSDPLAVETARKNLVQNQIDQNRFSIHEGHLTDCISRPHQLVVANILAHVIIDLLDDVPKVLARDGLFICSGIIKAQEDQVADKMKACGLDLLEIAGLEDWVAMVGKKVQ